MYKYCKQTLSWKKINILKPLSIIVVLIGLTSFISYFIGSAGKTKYVQPEYQQLVILINEQENEQFTAQRFYDYLIQLNIKFPDIVFAQACLETGHFKSQIFKTNHNLFGMREAKRRIKTSTGTEFGYAYYNNWKESVLDYGFFQATYLNQIKTEEQYLEYLQQNYAEADNYKNLIMAIVKNNPYKLIK